MVDEADDRAAQTASGLWPWEDGDPVSRQPQDLAFVREFEDEKILVVANLSRFTQCVELDLSRHHEAVPVEVLGATVFPPSRNSRTCFPWDRMPSSGFICSHLNRARNRFPLRRERKTYLCFNGRAGTIQRGHSCDKLRNCFHDIAQASWFINKHRTIRQVSIHDVIRFTGNHGAYPAGKH